MSQKPCGEIGSHLIKIIGSNLQPEHYWYKQIKKIFCLKQGWAHFFSPKLKLRYGVFPDTHVLLEALGALGISHEAIDIIVLSHLHFDHVGGLLQAYSNPNPNPKSDSKSLSCEPKLELLFPNAKFLVSRAAFERNKAPLLRDRVSFISEIPGLLEQSGRLELIESDQVQHALLGENFKFWWSNGHTPGMLCTEIKVPGIAGSPEFKPLVFAADLIPARFWCHTGFAMGYDRCAEQLLEEKTRLLNYLSEQKGRLFFTHDPDYAVGCVEKTGVGKFKMKALSAAYTEQLCEFSIIKK